MQHKPIVVSFHKSAMLLHIDKVQETTICLQLQLKC